MPYPIPSDDDVRDLLEPRERMLFDMLQNQMTQTRLVTQALITVRWWAVVCSLVIAASLVFYGVVLILK